MGNPHPQDTRIPDIDEQTPLIPPENPLSNTGSIQPAPILDHEAGSPNHKQIARRVKAMIAGFIASIFIFEIAFQLIQSPMVRVYEDIICKNFYHTSQPELYPAGRDIPEELCKIPSVQSELALIRGLEPVFDAIPNLLTAIPLGMIADSPKVGRKPIVLAALIAPLGQLSWVIVVASFPNILPLRFVWFGSVFLFIGGLNVANAMLYTMIIDITTPAERASTFFTLQLVGSYIPTLISPPVTSRLMEKTGNWIPISIGMALAFVGCIVFSCMPETINFHDNEKNSLPGQAQDNRSESSNITSSPDILSSEDKLWEQCKAKYAEFIASSSFVLHSPHLIILVCSLMMTTVSVTRAMETLIYYASARYEIPIAKATLLNTINAATCIAVLFFLPFASTYLTGKLGGSTQRKDLLVAQISVMLFAVGWTIVGLAPTLPLAILGLVVYTLGSGFNGSVRSLAASYVEPHHQARLSSFIALMVTVGNTIGSPLLAGLYGWGVSTENPFWYGLPFLGLAVVFASICFALSSLLRLPVEGVPIVVDEDE